MVVRGCSVRLGVAVNGSATGCSGRRRHAGRARPASQRARSYRTLKPRWTRRNDTTLGSRPLVGVAFALVAAVGYVAFNWRFGDGSQPSFGLGVLSAAIALSVTARKHFL